MDWHKPQFTTPTPCTTESTDRSATREIMTVSQHTGHAHDTSTTDAEKKLSQNGYSATKSNHRNIPNRKVYSHVRVHLKDHVSHYGNASPNDQ